MKNRYFSNYYRFFKESFLLTLGAFVASFALESFLIPNKFVDGGTMGISLLGSFLTPLSLSFLIVVINLPFIFLGYKQIGRTFAIKTFIAIVLVSVFLNIIEYPLITHDRLLIAIFGGFLLGLGTGLSIRGGGALDGTEIFSIYFKKKVNLSIGEIIFLINVLIFSFAAFFLGIEVALYSILIYLSASKTIDFMIKGIEEYIGIQVISDKSEQVRKYLTEILGKSITVYYGRKGKDFKKKSKEIEILFTAVTRLEALKVKNCILSVDPNAVIIEQTIRDVKGGVIKKRPLN